MKIFTQWWGVVMIFVFLLVPSLVFQQYWLALVFFIFGLCFGIVELIAIKTTDESVSKKFWIWSEKHKVKAWIVLIGMLIAWCFLLLHFGGAHLL